VRDTAALEMFVRAAAAVLLATSAFAQGTPPTFPTCEAHHRCAAPLVHTLSALPRHRLLAPCAISSRGAALMRAVASADLGAEGSTSRDMLFSNPGAELPDVYLSESVVFVEEKCDGNVCTDNQKAYTIVLTHPPGMREDETVRIAAHKRARARASC
jgi:hypothetical protein